jgi:MFS family permease
VLLIVGMLTVGISSTPWTFFIGAAIFGLGSGYVASVRSLITSLVPQNNLATLYTSITTIQSIGAIVAGPMQAAVFNEGIDLGGHWLGMPFMMASGLYLTSMAALLYVRLPKGDDPTEEAADLI